MLRSQHIEYDRKACVICQQKVGEMHKVSTIPMGQRLFEYASSIEKKDVEIRLNSVCNPSDAVANDVLYHLKCYVHLQREAGKNASTDFIDVDHKARVVADIEILNLVEYKLSQGEILNMNTIHETYKSILVENGMEKRSLKDVYKKYLKQLIEEQIVDVKFIKSYRANESTQLCSSRTESEAFDSASIHSSADDFNLLFKAAKILRMELISHNKWQYKGNFTDFEAPVLLSTLVKWLIVGPHVTWENIIRADKIDKAVSIVTQLVMQSFKTNRQVYLQISH